MFVSRDFNLGSSKSEQISISQVSSQKPTEVSTQNPLQKPSKVIWVHCVRYETYHAFMRLWMNAAAADDDDDDAAATCHDLSSVNCLELLIIIIHHLLHSFQAL